MDYNNKVFEDMLGYNTQTIMDLKNHFSEARKPYEQLWKLLDAFDRGFFWDIIKKNIPSFALKPDTNWINYVKSSIVNGLYTGNYRGDVFPRSLKYKDLSIRLNGFIEYAFNKLNIDEHLISSGERAALLNFGAVQLGWNPDIIDGADTLFSGDLDIKFIDNLSLLLDPSVVDPYKGKAMFIMEEVPLVELKNESRFKDRIIEFENLRDSENNSSPSVAIPGMDESEYGKGYYKQRPRDSKDETVRLLTCYMKYQPNDSKGYRIDQIWLIEDGFILGVKPDIKPKTFPIRILYASPPVADPYGTPKTKLIIYNVIALNILDQIDATQIYASTKRPKVVSRRSMINETLFAKEGNNPDKLWIVDGDPNNVIRYVDIPELPRDRHLLKEKLELAIMRISGIDDRYTGRDTGSAQTTGAMDIMSQRISMSDNTRISMLKKFIRELTELILSFYIEYGGSKRPFPIYNKRGKIEDIETIDFEALKNDHVRFDFLVNVTPNLPNTVLRRADAANIIMEKQMQYQFNPPLMTPEEWLESQDIPQKYHILERMRAQRMQDDREELMSDLVNYTGMVNQGMRPEEAINQLAQERQLKREQPEILGNTKNSNSFQDRQQ